MPALSGLRTVAAAGTVVPLGTQIINAALTVKALGDNTGLIYIGNDGAGSVADDTGFQLAAGEAITFDFVGNLAAIRLDAAVNGEGVTWIALDA